MCNSEGGIGSMDRFVSIFFTVIMAVVSTRLISQLSLAVLSMRFHGFKPPKKYLSPEEHPFPVQHDLIGERIARLGFQLVAIEIIGAYGRKDRFTDYIFVNPAAFSSMEVVFMKKENDTPHIEFRSAFTNDAVVLTTHPIGERIDEPHFTASFARQAMETAWERHRAAFLAQRERHGEPRPAASAEDVRAVDTLFNQKYRLRYFRRSFILCVVGLIVTFLMLASFLINMTASETNLTGLLPFVGLGVFFLYFRWFNKQQTHPPGAIDDPKPERVW